MKIFVKYIKKNKIKSLLIVMLLILSSLIILPLPYFSKLIIDNVLIKQQFYEIKIIFLGFIAILFLQVLIGRLLAINSATYNLKLNKFLKMNVFQNNLKALKETNQISHIQTILLTDIDLLCNNIMQIFSTFFSNITSLIGYLIVISVISMKLTIITISFVPIYVIWLIIVSKKLKLLNYESQKTKESLLKESNDVFNNYLVIKIYNLVNIAKSNFYRGVDSNVEVTKKIVVYNNFINIVSRIIITSAAFIPLFFGINLVKNNNLTIGELIAFNSYCGILFSPITSIVQMMPIIKTIEVYEQRIQNALINTENIKEISFNKLIENPTLDLVNINIKNETGILLQNIKLTVTPGDFIHLIGNNGSGKSLLLKTIIQYYPNFSGEIYFDKLCLNNSDISKLSEQIIYVSNEQYIYMDSLKLNLINNNSDMKDKLIWDILELVCLTEKINKLPLGLETPKFEVEKKFSTGELQKLRLARALLMNPKILILDETLSNVDNINAISILNSIKQKFPKMAVIIIDHHLNLEELINWKWEIKHRIIRTNKITHGDI